MYRRPACTVGLLNEVRIAENGCVLFVSFILIPLIAVQNPMRTISCRQRSRRCEGSRKGSPFDRLLNGTVLAGGILRAPTLLRRRSFRMVDPELTVGAKDIHERSRPWSLAWPGCIVCQRPLTIAHKPQLSSNSCPPRSSASQVFEWAGRQTSRAAQPDLVAQHRAEKYVLHFLSFHGTEEKTRLR